MPGYIGWRNHSLESIPAVILKRLQIRALDFKWYRWIGLSTISIFKKIIYVSDDFDLALKKQGLLMKIIF
jgi:hypothetical protein